MDVDADPAEEPPALKDLAVVLCQGVARGRHSAGFMGLKTYDDVFTGSDAVEFLVRNGFARSRGEAIRLGNSLIAEKYMHHVKDARQPLKDKPTSLYKCVYPMACRRLTAWFSGVVIVGVARGLRGWSSPRDWRCSNTDVRV